ncbi:hypothetical protein ACMSDP_25175 [Bacteroides thetaiotaomicron]|uniref:hypothetical protein n=1 Tax=Bacteroides thetaiotaomicron TaxID=818 RepID=UPI0039C1FB4E
MQGKYEKVNDFRRKVIDVAKKELDESSPYSFVAKEEKAGKKNYWLDFLPCIL